MLKFSGDLNSQTDSRELLWTKNVLILLLEFLNVIQWLIARFYRVLLSNLAEQLSIKQLKISTVQLEGWDQGRTLGCVPDTGCEAIESCGIVVQVSFQEDRSGCVCKWLGTKKRQRQFSVLGGLCDIQPAEIRAGLKGNAKKKENGSALRVTGVRKKTERAASRFPETRSFY